MNARQGRGRVVATVVVAAGVIGAIWLSAAALGAPGDPAPPSAPPAVASAALPQPGQLDLAAPEPVESLASGWALSQAESPVKAKACDPDAVVVPQPGDSAARREALANNPRSNRHSGAVSLPDSASAIAFAQGAAATPEQAGNAGWTESRFADPLAAAVVVPSSATEASLWSSDLIARQRCVWVITVQAPFVPQGTPPGKTATVYDEYTVIVDQASGEGLAIQAGPGILNAITGEGLS